MSNPTTPFSWQMPTNTDLVTDLPADFAVFGQAVATSMADLLGGTTGQVLSKTTNADMDFTWVAANPGDITGVTAGTGISGGGTSGTVTVSIDTAVTADLTTAQTFTNKKLSDSTTSIVDVSDATKAVKFDVGGTTGITGTIATAFTTAKTITLPDTTGTVALTNGVINNTLTSTTGDIIYASAANTPARLGIGSSSQVLTVSGGIPAWQTLASGYVGVGLYKSSSQVIPNTTSTDVTWDSERWDTNSFHSGSDAKITIPSGKTGYYLQTIALFWNDGSGISQIYVRKNGGAFMRYDGNFNTTNSQTVSDVYYLTAADYINLEIYQMTGSNRTISGGSSISSWTLTYLGA